MRMELTNGKETRPRNFELYFDGEFGGLGDFGITFPVKKTIKMRIKYWLLCKILPFRIVRWE
jgi:hypothetical protein